MKSDILEDLLSQELRSLYSAEKLLLKALKKLAGAARHPKLQNALRSRQQETAGQVGRLEQIAELLGKKLPAVRCRGMELLLAEMQGQLAGTAGDAAHDAKVITAARNLGHYEVEAYVMAITLAARLGLDEIELLLQRNLNEERAADARLAKLASTLHKEQRCVFRSTPRERSTAAA